MGLMLAALLASIAHAQPAIDPQAEVRYLLASVETSGCEFFRNDQWYDSKAAETHLSEKYQYLSAIGLIDTTEDFIEKVATRSSFTGQPYEVRCHGGPTMTGSQWLRDELARFRTHRRPASQSEGRPPQ